MLLCHFVWCALESVDTEIKHLDNWLIDWLILIFSFFFLKKYIFVLFLQHILHRSWKNNYSMLFRKIDYISLYFSRVGYAALVQVLQLSQYLEWQNYFFQHTLRYIFCFVGVVFMHISINKYQVVILPKQVAHDVICGIAIWFT